MAKLEKRSKVKFAKILADGAFHVECNADEVDATQREVEKTDGTKVVYIEQVYQQLSGKITSLEVKDGDYGRMIYISLDNEIVLTAGAKSNFGRDILKKIPNIKVEEEVVFAPYSFNDEKGKNIKGVNIYQNGEKLYSFFQEGKGKETKNINGYPDVDEKKKPSASEKTKHKKFWSAYFDSVEDFLVEYVQKNHTIAFVADTKGDSDADDIPFD